MPPEQKAAADFVIENKRCALWMMPGLGKTLATISAIEALNLQRILVVAPLRCCVLVWPEELEKWLPGAEYRHIKGTPDKRISQLIGNEPFHLINYELLDWLLRWDPDVFTRYDMVVFDESSKLKSWATRRFKALKKPILKAKRVVELTGTPAPNGLLGVWSQLYLLDQGASLGKFISHYKQNYFDQDYMGWNWEPKDPERIYDRCKGLVYSLRNTQYRDMVKQIRVPVELHRPPYEAMKRDGLVSIFGYDIVARTAAVQGLKLRQLANGFIYTDDEPGGFTLADHKINALKDLVDELAGQPLIVFYEFKHDLVRLKKHFPKAVEFADEHVRDWNAGKIEVMLMSPWSAGHGLNLQGGGNRVCWFNPPFDLEIHEQANARVARKGQKADGVMAYYLVAEDSIDMHILKVLEAKDATQDDLMRALEKELTILTP